MTQNRMQRGRTAVTLMEVLIALFIMAIGLIALMALFPIGAVSMATALKDDRCAYASSMAESVSVVKNIRYGDLDVARALLSSPSGLVYVDPYGVLYSVPPLGPLGGVIPRVTPNFITNTGNFVPPVTPQQLTDRWFSLPDDITFSTNGTPDTSITGGIVDRGRRYTFAYLLRRIVPAGVNPNAVPVQLYAVVYSGRPAESLATITTEWPLTLAAPGIFSTNWVQVNGVATTLKRGAWIFEPVNGYFYRVTNLAEDAAAGTTTVELQSNLLGPSPIMRILAMDYVAEVFDKGYGFQQ